MSVATAKQCCTSVTLNRINSACQGLRRNLVFSICRHGRFRQFLPIRCARFQHRMVPVPLLPMHELPIRTALRTPASDRRLNTTGTILCCDAPPRIVADDSPFHTGPYRPFEELSSAVANRVCDVLTTAVVTAAGSTSESFLAASGLTYLSAEFNIAVQF